jgi:TRAP-type C4-dicarboxylate transport system permease small subunit
MTLPTCSIKTGGGYPKTNPRNSIDVSLEPAKVSQRCYDSMGGSIMKHANHRLRDTFLRITDIFLIVLLAAIIVIVFGQVCARYIFNNPFMWAEELVRFVFIWMVFIGAAVATLNERHYTVTFFVDLLPRPARKVWILCTNMIICLFTTILAFYSVKLLEVTSMQKSTALEISWTWVYISLSIGLFLIIIITCIRIYRQMVEFKKNANNVAS